MPEVLPFIAGHHVEVMFFVEIFEILGIHTERKIALEFLFCAVATIVERLGSGVFHHLILFTFRHIGTQCEVQA